jgi:hypothetical protein
LPKRVQLRLPLARGLQRLITFNSAHFNGTRFVPIVALESSNAAGLPAPLKPQLHDHGRPRKTAKGGKADETRAVSHRGCAKSGRSA